MLLLILIDFLRDDRPLVGGADSSSVFLMRLPFDESHLPYLAESVVDSVLRHPRVSALNLPSLDCMEDEEIVDIDDDIIGLLDL